jgi:hypothetical protein
LSFLFSISSYYLPPTPSCIGPSRGEKGHHDMRTAVEQKEKEDNKVRKNKAKDLACAKRKREAMIRDLLSSSN